MPDTAARPWRSPPDQPAWARPALLAIAALAGLAYAWGMNDAALELYYGAAARSMSMSWHNFFFGAFDPTGTISVDKLPGALWPQALLLRIVGFHVWAVVLPQVIEGVVTSSCSTAPSGAWPDRSPASSPPSCSPRAR